MKSRCPHGSHTVFAVASLSCVVWLAKWKLRRDIVRHAEKLDGEAQLREWHRDKARLYAELGHG